MRVYEWPMTDRDWQHTLEHVRSLRHSLCNEIPTIDEEDSALLAHLQAIHHILITIKARQATGTEGNKG